jgi:hypothetical protein
MDKIFSAVKLFLAYSLEHHSSPIRRDSHDILCMIRAMPESMLFDGTELYFEKLWRYLFYSLTNYFKKQKSKDDTYDEVIGNFYTISLQFYQDLIELLWNKSDKTGQLLYLTILHYGDLCRDCLEIAAFLYFTF